MVIPMTAKAQRTARKRDILMRGLFQASGCSADAVVGDGRLSLRSCEFSPSSRVRPPSVVMSLGETMGLSCFSTAGCNSMGSSKMAVEEPPLRCSTLMLCLGIPVSEWQILNPSAGTVEVETGREMKTKTLKALDSHACSQSVKPVLSF